MQFSIGGSNNVGMFKRIRHVCLFSPRAESGLSCARFWGPIWSKLQTGHSRNPHHLWLPDFETVRGHSGLRIEHHRTRFLGTYEREQSFERFGSDHWIGVDCDVQWVGRTDSSGI